MGLRLRLTSNLVSGHGAATQHRIPCDDLARLMVDADSHRLTDRRNGVGARRHAVLEATG